jgi:GT2 family glycosyltransferase/glycosyltransferase involved in cell wall biosynthesis
MSNSAQKIDILIPVFEATADLAACLDSIIACTSSEHSVLVLDDASQDSAIERNVLRLAGQYSQLSYDRSCKNLGFVGNVNRALQRTRNDVVILNSDTLVTPGWLEAIIDCRDSCKAIGIVSPLSNNATILSVPQFNADNDLPAGMTPAHMASLVAAVSKRTYPRIPTAVGFCMLITRSTIDRLGLFDPAFGRGYGEECDYSVRAWRAGIEVACCDNAFVFHRGSASFGQGAAVSSEKIRNRHLLNQRWPGYEQAVQRFCANNPLRSLLTTLSERIEARGNEPHASLPHVLSLCHRWETDGGVEKHVKDISLGLASRFRFSVVHPTERPEQWTDFSEQRTANKLRIIARNHAYPRSAPRVFGFPLEIELAQSEADLSRLLSGSDAGIVHIHHLMLWNNLKLPLIARQHGKKVVISLHDFYLLCPNYNMFLVQQVPCHQPVLDLDREICQTCLGALIEPSPSAGIRQLSPDYAKRRYNLVHAALLHADALIAPSQFVREVFGRAFGSYIAGRIQVIPHGVSPMGLAEVPPLSESLRVAYVGNLNLGKGAQLLMDTANNLRAENVSFVVHGNVDPAFVPHLQGLGVQLAGRYRREQLAQKLSGVDVVIVLSIFYETFCMALSEAQAAGIPIIAPRAGGIAERISDGSNGFLYERGDMQGLTTLLREFSRDRTRLQVVREKIRTQPPRLLDEMLEDYQKLYEELLPRSREHYLIALGRENRDESGHPREKRARDCDFLEYFMFPDHTGVLGDPAFSSWYTARQRRASTVEATNCGAVPLRLCWLVRTEFLTLACLPKTIASIKCVLAAESAIVVLLTDPTLELSSLPQGVTVARIDDAKAPFNGILAQRVAFNVEWIALINAGDEVSRDMVLDLRQAPFQTTAIKAIYFDEDRITVRGEHYSPNFKPDFDRLWFESAPYVGDFALCRPEEVLAANLTMGDLPLVSYAVLASVLARQGAKAIGHVSGIHYHALDIERMLPSQRLEEVAQVLARQIHNKPFRIEIDQERKYCRRLPVTSTRPGISIIVASADSNLLNNCLHALEAQTDDANIELIGVLVGHGLRESLQETHLQQVRILTLPFPTSHAEALHRGGMHAQKEILLLLSDAITISGTLWVKELASLFSEDDIGVVGASVRRLHQNVCTSGFILGVGAHGIASYAGESSLNEPISPEVPREFSALPGECVAIRRTLFLDLGGLSFRYFGRTYWSIDLCLRAREANFRVCWTSRWRGAINAAASLAVGSSPEEAAEVELNERNHLLQQWKHGLLRDPAYNDSLSIAPGRLGIPDEDNIRPHPFVSQNVAALPRLMVFPFDSWGSGQYRARGPSRGLASAGKTELRILSNHDSGMTTTVPEIWRFSPKTLLVHNFLHDYQLQALASYRAHCNVNIIMGLDDLLTEIPAYNPYSKTIYPDIESRLAKALNLCDRLIVTTDDLARHFRHLIEDIRVVPNTLEAQHWQIAPGERKRIQNGRIRVGWAGAKQHLGDLAILIPIVKRTYHEVDWIFFGQCPPEIASYALEIHPMVAFEDYPQRLASLNLDVAVAPLVHNRFNKAKSNLRILEYGILGIPVIGSDIKPYRDAPVLRLSDDSNGWVEAIRQYARSPHQAALDGAKLKNWVTENWLLENHLAEWEDALMLNVRGCTEDHVFL